VTAQTLETAQTPKSPVADGDVLIADPLNLDTSEEVIAYRPDQTETDEADEAATPFTLNYKVAVKDLPQDVVMPVIDMTYTSLVIAYGGAPEPYEYLLIRKDD
jgi:hypothetical protein